MKDSGISFMRFLVWTVGANGLSIKADLGLLSDAVGPLRSCFDFRGVILFPKQLPGTCMLVRKRGLPG